MVVGSELNAAIVNHVSKQVTWCVMSTDDVMLMPQSDVTQRSMSSYEGLCHHMSSLSL